MCYLLSESSPVAARESGWPLSSLLERLNRLVQNLGVILCLLYGHVDLSLVEFRQLLPPFFVRSRHIPAEVK